MTKKEKKPLNIKANIYICFFLLWTVEKQCLLVRCGERGRFLVREACGEGVRMGISGGMAKSQKLSTKAHHSAQVSSLDISCHFFATLEN